jgi:hypothetical protein
MTLDDDSLLSAYMDGQLNPEQHQAVESALVADPQLAEQLRHLTTVRELLAGLSRDDPVDVTGPVMNRIRMRAPLRAVLAAVFPPGGATPRWTRAAGRIAIAATILIALVIPWPFGLRLLPPGRPQGHRNPVATDRRTSPPSTSPVRPRDASQGREPSFISAISADDASRRVDAAGPRPGNPDEAGRDALATAEIEHARRYLDHPDLRHILMVADLDGTAQQQVASVVEQTTRFNYVKITIAQGIVIDPRHPDQATVFALVVNPTELVTLRQRLRVQLKDRVEEQAVDPAIVTQLADIGDVQTFKSRPAGEVWIPRDTLAIKDLGPTPEQFRSAPVDVAPSRSGAVPRSEANRSVAAAASAAEAPALAPVPVPDRVAGTSDARGPGGPPAPAEMPDQDLVVLVWVSRTRSGFGQ